MENRFGFKDLVIAVLMVVLIISVWFAMKQFDRQWDEVKQSKAILNEQTSGQARLLRDLSETNDLVRRLSAAGGQSAEATKQLAEIQLVLKQLAEKQLDSQKLAQQLEELQKRLADLEKNPAKPTTTDESPDAFTRVRKVTKRDDYSRGDWLIDSFSGQPATMTPNLPSADAYTSIVGNKVLECLLTRDPQTWEWRGLLAESWKVEDNSKAWSDYAAKRASVPMTEEEVRKEAEFPSQEDKQAAYIQRRLKEGRRPLDIGSEAQCPPGVVATFKLRRGVTFSDGEPFTADDVVFTAQWIQNPQVSVPRARSAFVEVKEVVKTGPDEVVFKFKRPYFEAMELAGTIEILAKHFYGKYTPKQYNESTGMLFGSGPYKLASTDWTPGKPIELVRNERYWGVPGPFDKIAYKVIEKEPIELQAFKNGEIDSLAAEPEQARQLLKDEKIMARVNYLEFLSVRQGYMYIAWNQQRNGKPTRFADKEIRQAMTMLIDREKLCQHVFEGKAQPTSGPFNELGDQDDPTIQPWPYDPAKARALLKTKGYEDRDGDGVLESASGEPLRVKISYPAPSEVYDRVLLFVKDNMARGGVVLELDPCGWPLMLKKLNTRDFDAITLNWTASIETDVYQMFHSTQTAEEADNFMYYINPQLDKSIDEARQTIDYKQRMEVWRGVHRLLHEDQPYTFMFRRKSMVFFDKRIKNIYQTRSGLNHISYWIMPMEWYVPKGEQKWK